MYCSKETRMFLKCIGHEGFQNYSYVAIFSRNIMLTMSSLNHICDSMKDVSLAKRTYALARTLLTLSFDNIDFGTWVKFFHHSESDKARYEHSFVGI